MRRIWILVPVVLACAGTCQGPYGPNNACLTIAEAECRFAFECCTAQERGQFALGTTQFADEDSCREQLAATSPQCVSLTAVDDAVRAGRFSYDEDKAKACIEPFVIAADTCDPKGAEIASQGVQGTGEACRGFPFLGDGLVGPGGRCEEDGDCEKGGTCQHNNSDPNVVTVEGRCAAAGKDGDPCPSDGNCGRDLFCDASFDTGAGPKCRALKGNGAACNSFFECKSALCDFSQSTAVCTDAIKDDRKVEVCNGKAQ